MGWHLRAGMGIVFVLAFGCSQDNEANIASDVPIVDVAMVDDASITSDVRVISDTGVADTGVADTGVADTGVADTGVADTGVVDTGVVDTGIVDTGIVDTGIVDTGIVDTGVVDTGVVDTGVVDTGVVDTGIVDTGIVDAAPGTDVVVDGGSPMPACGARGQPCCAGSMCNAGSECRSGMCSCIQTEECICQGTAPACNSVCPVTHPLARGAGTLPTGGSCTASGCFTGSRQRCCRTVCL